MSLKDETSAKIVKDDDTVVLTLRNGDVKERERSVSPVRVNPFLVKDRGSSPTKKPAPAPLRSYSPEKPHPLQFVSPAYQSPAKSSMRQERGRSPTKKPTAPQSRSYSPEKPLLSSSICCSWRWSRTTQAQQNLQGQE